MAVSVNAYHLTVLNPGSGQRRRSLVFAPNERLAKAMALRDISEVVTVERTNSTYENLLRLLIGTRAKVADLRECYSSIASCLSINPSIVRALELTIPNITSPPLQYSMAKLLDDVGGGTHLSEAIKALNGVIPYEHIVMLAAGEKSGNIPEVFAKLAEALDKADKTISKLKRAMTYPCIVFLIGGAALVLASLFLVPKLAEMFHSFKAELPPITKAMIGVSDFLRTNNWFVAVLAAIPVLVFKNLDAIWAHPTTQGAIDLIPFARRLVYKTNMYRCLTTLCMLRKSNIDLPEALELTAKATSHRRISSFFSRMRTDILTGSNPFEAANNHRALLGVDGFQLMSHIHLGAENGTLTEVLEKVSITYRDDVDAQIKNIEVIIEPLTIVLVGAFIGFLALAVMLPLAKLNTLIAPPRS